MKNLLFLPLVLLLFACSNQPDNERIVGKWVYKEVTKNGKLIATTDASKQEKVVEERMKLTAQLFPAFKVDKETERKRVAEEMKSLKSSGYEFTKDFFFEFKEDGDTKRPKNYKLDEQKKTISLVSKRLTNRSKEVIHYSFEGDNLVLKMEEYEFVLSRK